MLPWQIPVHGAGSKLDLRSPEANELYVQELRADWKSTTAVCGIDLHSAETRPTMHLDTLCEVRNDPKEMI